MIWNGGEQSGRRNRQIYLARIETRAFCTLPFPSNPGVSLALRHSPLLPSCPLPSQRTPPPSLSSQPNPLFPPYLESSSCLPSGSSWSSMASKHMKSGGTSCIWTLGAPVRHLTFSITVCLIWSRYWIQRKKKWNKNGINKEKEIKPKEKGQKGENRGRVKRRATMKSGVERRVAGSLYWSDHISQLWPQNKHSQPEQVNLSTN